MSVWAYTLVRNEATLMPYFVRHYGAFCERVIVYDEQSDDGTPEIARRGGAEVRTYVGNGTLDDLAFVAFANRQYREARGRADWVIWVDGDEFVYHPRIAERLAELRAAGATVARILGFNMMSDRPPTGGGQIWEEIPNGEPAGAYAKVCVVDPALEVEWIAGKHTAVFRSPPAAVWDDGADPLKLLHYRWLGADYYRARNERNLSRLSENNLRFGMGYELFPGYVGEYSPAWYDGRLELARPCV